MRSVIYNENIVNGKTTSNYDNVREYFEIWEFEKQNYIDLKKIVASKLPEELEKEIVDSLVGLFIKLFKQIKQISDIAAMAFLLENLGFDRDNTSRGDFDVNTPMYELITKSTNTYSLVSETDPNRQYIKEKLTGYIKKLYDKEKNDH